MFIAAGAPVTSAATCAVASAIASDLAVAIAVACAVDTGFAESAVFVTFPRPRVAAVTAATSDLSARSDVSVIPCTFVVTELCVPIFVSAAVAAAVVAADVAAA